MTNIKLLLEAANFIQAYIDGSKLGFYFNGDKLHTEGDHKLYWNNKVIADENGLIVSEYELPPATDEELGGIIVGDRLSVEGDGTLSADKQTWSDIISGSAAADVPVSAPDLSIFSNTNPTQNDRYITVGGVASLLSSFEAVKNVFIADGTEEDTGGPLGYANGDFIVVRNDGTEEALFNTIADVDISIRTGDELDPDEEDPTINQEGVYLVVNFGEDNQTFTDLTALIPTFNGHDGTHILTTVTSGVIAAQLKNGTIKLESLHTEVTDILSAVATKMAKVISADENNIAVFDDAGQVKDSGKAISDLVLKTDFDAKFHATTGHTHNGTTGNGPKLSYGDFKGIPVSILNDSIVGEGTGTLEFGEEDFDVKYLIVSGSERMMGNIRVSSGIFTHYGVSGDEIDVLFGLSGSGEGIAITNNETSEIDVQLNVSFYSPQG